MQRKKILSVLVASLLTSAYADVNTDAIDKNVQNITSETPSVSESEEISHDTYIMGSVDENYRSYFPKEGENISMQKLQLLLGSLQQRAQNDRHKLHINVDKQTRIIDVNKSLSSKKPTQVFAVLDTDGPRYAGPTMLTVGGSVVGVVPHTKVTAYVTEGLKGRDTGKDSKFQNISVKADTATPYASVTTMLTHSESNATQNDVIGLQTNATTKFSVDASRALNKNFTLEGGLQTTKTKSVLKDFELSDTVTYSSAHVKLSASHSLNDANVQWSVEREEGLGTSRKGDATIQGKVANSWHTNTFEMAFQKGNVSTKLGYQESSEGTPSAAMGYIGGPGRGSSFDAGTYSGDAVSYYDLRYTFKPIKNVLPFVSINGGATDKEHVSSLQLGGSVNVWGGALRASLSQTLEGEKIKNNGKARLSVNFSKVF